MSTPQMPSASGVRSAGDDYHYLHGWRLCMRVLLEQQAGNHPNPGTHVGVEVPHVGNADDLVYYRANAPHTYYQVKYAADATSPLGLTYLTENNLLGKLATSHVKVTADNTTAHLQLLTNRLIDPTDALLTRLDDRTNMLVPRGLEGGPKSDLGKARRQWVTAAAFDSEAELIALLNALQFKAGYKPDMLRDNIGHMMTAAGLRSDPRAIDLGKDWINRRVIDGHRNQTHSDILAALDELDLHAGTPWASVSVATLDLDPLAPQAVATVDWVDNMENPGAEAWTRVQPAAPHTWDELAAELDTIPTQVGSRTRLLVTGTMRQATGFKTGAVLRQTLGYDVGIRQRGQLWTGAAPTTTYPLNTTVHDLNAGNDIALIVNVATDINNAALNWITDQGLPVSKALSVAPATGPGPNSVPTAEAANSLAIAIRDVARQHAPLDGDIHLFLAGPGGLALLLGHHWNRTARTHVYEHLRGQHYTHAFTVHA